MSTVYIIVVGAGEVGSYVAERLSRQGHDIAIVENSARRLRAVAERLDVLTVLGSGTSPRIMAEAGLDQADIVVAVTSSDEVNLLASLLAKQAGVDRTVVRIEHPDLRARDAQPLHRAAGIDLIIDPDEETADEILELLLYPGASEVTVMGGGEIMVIGARIGPDAPIVGRTLGEIGDDYEPEWEFIFGAISRDGQTIIPRADQTIEADDLLRVVCKRRARRELARLLGLARDVPNRVTLLGGGRTAEILAERLSRRGAAVAIVERDPERALELAGKLERVLVLEGEITDADLLLEAEIDASDAAIALTGEDHANILACLFAKSVGAGETIAVVHRLELLPLLGDAGVDVALSPRTASANAVLRFVRGGVTQVATFLEADAEVLELEVKEGSKADGAKISELRLPKDMLVGAVIRDGKARIGRGRSQLRHRDHVVVVTTPGSVDEAKQFFG